MGLAAQLMIHTVSRKLRTAVDAGLAPTYGSLTTFAARVERKTQEVADAAGRVKVAQHRVISETEVFLSDRIWLPGADTTDDNKAQDPIAVGQAETTSGYVLYEAFL